MMAAAVWVVMELRVVMVLEGGVVTYLQPVVRIGGVRRQKRIVVDAAGVNRQRIQHGRVAQRAGERRRVAGESCSCRSGGRVGGGARAPPLNCRDAPQRFRPLDAHRNYNIKHIMINATSTLTR